MEHRKPYTGTCEECVNNRDGLCRRNGLRYTLPESGRCDHGHTRPRRSAPTAAQRWTVMGMAEVMLGKELHPDRVIPVEKLYEILNEYEINYSFPAQCEIENNAFAVVRCKDCKHYHHDKHHGTICRHPELDYDVECYDHWINTKPDDFCSYGERKDNGSD